MLNQGRTQRRDPVEIVACDGVADEGATGEDVSEPIAVVGCEEDALAACRGEFERLLCFAQGEGRQLEAHAAEEGLYRRLLSLGLTLLRVYFACKGRGPEDAALLSQGKIWPRKGVKPRVYRSIFGAVRILRTYFYRDDEGGFCPLDAELNLREDGYSRLLCQWSNFWSVRQAFAKVSDWLHMLLGLRVWTRPLEQMSRTAAVDAEGFLAHTTPVKVSDEAKLLVVSADCKGVPMRRPASPKPRGKRRKKGEKANKKKMAVVTAIYNVAPHVRTASDFMKGGWSWLSGRREGDPTPPAAPKPEGKLVWATLKGKAHAIELAAAEVNRRDPEARCDLVILVDGEKALQQPLASTFARAKAVILDFVHVVERLWTVANVLHGEGSQEAERWVGLRVQTLLHGRVGRVIGGLKQLLTKRKSQLSAHARKVIGEAITYYENNRDRMAYGEYLAAGYPVATGVVEGTCRHLVKDRMELAGMHWTEEGAEAVLALRAIQINGHWDDFWRFHAQRDHARLYAAHADAQGVPWGRPGASRAA